MGASFCMTRWDWFVVPAKGLGIRAGAAALALGQATPLAGIRLRSSVLAATAAGVRCHPVRLASSSHLRGPSRRPQPQTRRPAEARRQAQSSWAVHRQGLGISCRATRLHATGAPWQSLQRQSW